MKPSQVKKTDNGNGKLQRILVSRRSFDSISKIPIFKGAASTKRKIKPKHYLIDEISGERSNGGKRNFIQEKKKARKNQVAIVVSWTLLMIFLLIVSDMLLFVAFKNN